MTRALRRARVPAAGADRLTLDRHIAVLDLCAAARVALNPDDDLALAAVLKSPLIGLDDEALDGARARPQRARSAAELAASQSQAWEKLSNVARRGRDAGSVRFLRAAARRGWRPAGAGRAARRGGRRRHRRISRPRARPRAGRGAVAARASSPRSRRRTSQIKRDMEAAGAAVQGDDRARLQGARSADRLPARHGERAERPARSELAEARAAPFRRGAAACVGGLGGRRLRRHGRRPRRRARGRRPASTAACSMSR